MLVHVILDRICLLPYVPKDCSDLGANELSRTGCLDNLLFECHDTKMVWLILNSCFRMSSVSLLPRARAILPRATSNFTRYLLVSLLVSTDTMYILR